jgi:hypothetical protein
VAVAVLVVITSFRLVAVQAAALLVTVLLQVVQALQDKGLQVVLVVVLVTIQEVVVAGVLQSGFRRLVLQPLVVMGVQAQPIQ